MEIRGTGEGDDGKGELGSWREGGFQWKPFFVERRFIASAADFDEVMRRLGNQVTDRADSNITAPKPEKISPLLQQWEKR